MEKHSSVKISQNTLKKLHLMASKLSIIKGKRLNLDETIDSILDIAEKSSSSSDLEKDQLEKDRKDFLTLIKHKIKGAGPEEYASYDFNENSSL